MNWFQEATAESRVNASDLGLFVLFLGGAALAAAAVIAVLYGFGQAASALS